MRVLFFSIIILTLSYLNTYSQVAITIESIPPLYNVNMEEFPLMKLNVRVTDGENPVELKQNQFYILEEAAAAMVSEPFEVSPLVNGWQTIKWYTKLNDFTKIGDEVKDYFGALLVIYDNQPYRLAIRGKVTLAPLLLVVSGTNQQQVRDLRWENISPGNSIPSQIKIRGLLRDARTMKESPIKIDSLSTNTKYFTIKWLGPLIGEKREPPAEIAANFDYLVNIYFTPETYSYYQDVLTIYYNNGMKKYIPLYANNFKLDVKKIIKLTEPQPGTIFAPCQDIVIKWQGHSVEYPVELSYSTDAGMSWKVIDVVSDSMYKWKIPDIETKFLKFKVKQDFQNTKTQVLSEDRYPVFGVNYNSAGTILSSINSVGKVMTWNLTTQPSSTLLRKQQIEDYEDGSTIYFNSFGVVYSNSDSKFYVGYRNLYIPSMLRRDTIAVFNSDDTYPYKRISLPQGFFANKMYSDRQRKLLTVIPYYGNKLLQYSMTDESLVKEYAFEQPIMDVAYSTTRDSMAVLLINGRVQLLRTADFSVFDTMDFSLFPNFIKIAYSPDGKMVTLGGQNDGTGLKTNSFLVDIATRQIVKTFNPSFGSALATDFNPTSTSVILGSETDMQIAIYDLTSTSETSNLFGHTDILTDLKLSPNGLSIVSTSVAQNDNIVYRSFTYPQEDESEGYIKVERPALNIDLIRIADAYLGTDNVQNVSSICNIGNSMADIYDAKFLSNKHFHLTKAWVRDTTFTGDCFNFEINYAPLDTGIIRDTLVLYHCSMPFFIPFESYSIPRTITLLSDNFDFGEVCIGETKSEILAIFRNDDPVPLKLNNLAFRTKDSLYFALGNKTTDTIIEPGGTYAARINFTPLSLGFSTAELDIYHSLQTKIFSTMKVKGTGIGSYIDVSHNIVRFIPEIPIREITMKNIGVTDINFEQFRIEPEGNFEVLTPAGFILKPNEEKTIQIRWLGKSEEPAQLVTDANPCLVQRYIPLTFYRGTSYVKVATVTTEANNENVRIPITYKNTENGAYNGTRNFEADFEVNYKLFLPRSVESKFGEASITHNTVQGGIRNFGIKIEGDFPLEDTVAVIVGVAGLSDVDRSPIDLMTNSLGWSKFVNMTSESGEIIISGICEDRYVIRNQGVIQNLLVMPNPVSDIARVNFTLSEDATIYCDLIDNTGCFHTLVKPYNARMGENLLNINLSKFGTGNYKLRISTPEEFSTTNIIIIR